LKKIKEFYNNLFKNKKIKKTKTESRQLPKGKKYNPKVMRGIVWFALIILISSGVLAFIRSGNALSLSREVDDKVQEEDTQQLENQEAYDSPTFKVYASHFVNDYINIPQDEEERDEYKDKLTEYFVSEDFLPDIEFDGNRELIDKTLYGTEQAQDHIIAKYKVNYKVHFKDKDKDSKTKEAMLNIPIKYKDNGFGVVESVHFTDVPVLENNQQKAISSDYEEDSEEELSMNEKEEIEAWTKDFFHDYAEKTKEDMAYMMDEPQALNGLQEFTDFEDFKVYEKDNKYIAKVKAIFKDPDADIVHEEPYTLNIKQENNKYYVEDMKNSIGGK